jgi:hypothetical protein
MTTLAELSINGSVCGQAFIKLIPAQGSMKYPRLVILDPQITRIVTDPDDCNLHYAYIIEYPGTNDYQKRQIIARVDPNGTAHLTGDFDPDDIWTITNYERKGMQGTWMQVGSSDDWPYPFPPVFCCKNLPNPNEPWGKPDLTPDIIQQNKNINFVQSNISRILKWHAHPKTWAKGVAAAQLQMSPEDVLVLQADNAQIGNLEMQSDLGSSLNFLSMMRSNMDEQTRVPAVALGRQEELPKGNLSGVALALLFQPLIELTTQKRRLYGKLIREVSRAALVLGGQIPVEEYEDFDVTLKWENLLPVDDLQSAQEAILLQQLGVSNSTILEQLGYDPDVEAKKSAKEDTRKVQAYAAGQGLPPMLPNQQGTAQPDVQNMTPANGGQNAA